MMNRLIALVLIVLGFTAVASAQTKPTRVSATIEATAGASVETSFNQPQQGIVLYGQRWKPASKILRITDTPTPKLSLTGRFDLGTVDDAPMSVEPISGRNYPNLYPAVRSYVGALRQVEIGGSYQLLPHLAAAVNYVHYTLKDDEELLHAQTVDGAGWIRTYTSTNRYQGLGAGATTDYSNDKVNVEAGLMWYPNVGRHFDSLERSLGETYVNDIDVDGHTSGLQLQGRIGYQIMKHLEVTFSYRYQQFTTSWGEGDTGMGVGQAMYLKVLTPAFGFNIKF